MSALQQCSRCGKPFPVSGWDRLNGFLVRCPSCGVWNGRSWNVRAIGLASVFLNGLSFFFTMRPRAAIVALGLFAGFVYLTAAPATAGDHPNLEVAWYFTGFLTPTLVNTALLIRHQSKLGQVADASGAEMAAGAQGAPGIEPK